MNFCLKIMTTKIVPLLNLAYQINELNKHSENNKNEIFIFIFVEKNHVIAQPLRLKKGVSSKPSGMIVLASSY
jgi:hypothetical protein